MRWGLAILDQPSESLFLSDKFCFVCEFFENTKGVWTAALSNVSVYQGGKIMDCT